MEPPSLDLGTFRMQNTQPEVTSNQLPRTGRTRPPLGKPSETPRPETGSPSKTGSNRFGTPQNRKNPTTPRKTLGNPRKPLGQKPEDQ